MSSCNIHFIAACRDRNVEIILDTLKFFVLKFIMPKVTTKCFKCPTFISRLVLILKRFFDDPFGRERLMGARKTEATDFNQAGSEKALCLLFIGDDFD